MNNALRKSNSVRTSHLKNFMSTVIFKYKLKKYLLLDKLDVRWLIG
jgi:hypothetical protein